MAKCGAKMESSSQYQKSATGPLSCHPGMKHGGAKMYGPHMVTNVPFTSKHCKGY